MKNTSIIIVLLILFNLTSCKQTHEPLSDKYFRLLNNYQSDSLQPLLTDDFKVTLTYTTYFYNRADFFYTYLRVMKGNNETTRILKTINNKEPRQFLVEDRSDYLKYLGVRNPTTWVITIRTIGNKIDEVIVDTTETSNKYFKDVKEKSDQFTAWVSKKYPYDIPTGKLYDTANLLLKRLKEYKKEN